MTNDIAQQNLKEPEQVDWDNLGKSGYQAPPPERDAAGNPITYYGVVGGVQQAAPDEDYLNFLIDPIKLTKAGSYDGYQIRFTRVSTKPFQKNGAPIKGNPNKLANYLRACGLPAKPQTNSEYIAAAKVTAGKVVPFTIQWEAYNKETGESVRGWNAFPDDQERPGQKKSILKQGDVINQLDSKGNVIGQTTVKSEVLFANARLRFFQDPTKSQVK